MERVRKKMILTSARHEDLQRHLLKQVMSAEYSANLVKVPFAMKIVNILKNLKE